MNAKDLIAAGKLMEARAQLTGEVKAAPSDAAKRVLLFQVLAFLGEWEKAERHLDMVVSLNPTSETGVQVYMNTIHAEKERREVMAGKRRPGFVTGAPSYLDLYLAAWNELKKGKPEEAARMYKRVEAQRRPVSGSVDGKRFDGFLDTDAFLSCFLEVIVHDRYIWISFDSIRELSVDPPKTLFDLLWIPARLMTWEGVSLHCYIPVLYVDSSAQADERIKLGRMTEWLPLGGPFYKGVGRRVFQAGEDDIPLLELREVSFDFAHGEERS
ncbi:MAG: type VI secretion system accessory protein TagJ [Syntrophorhabdales bacterium]|jgi:type VI secretion system protein ImpE